MAGGSAYGAGENMSDSLPVPAADPAPPRFIHRIGVEVRPAAVIDDKGIPKGGSSVWSPSGSSFSTHLKYSFSLNPNTLAGKVHAGAYQGIGIGWFDFHEKKVLGNPTAFYLFQGAHIARISPRLSFDYEWNFGLSAPWKPYDPVNNPSNWVIGSKVNAYINASFYLNYAVSRHLELAAGVNVTHFSNGNTKFPNAGLNTAGAKFGVVYNFNKDGGAFPNTSYDQRIPDFPRHVSYDLVFFGSWRRRGILMGEETIMLPDSYTVLGFSFAPMYNFGHNFRAGVALDGFYDSSANLIFEDYIVPLGEYTEGPGFTEPPLSKQLALGLSGRVEFVMPYFTIGLGVGTNVLHGGGDMKSVYQILSLKIEVSRNSFVHVGYSLHNFKEPNFLMLGVGFRFNNKAPCHYRYR